MTQSKLLSCQLLEPITFVIITDGILEITIYPPSGPARSFQYDFIFGVDGFMSYLADYPLLLKLEDGTTGLVNLGIYGVPSITQTQFEVIFKDPIWINYDWMRLMNQKSPARGRVNKK